MKKMDKEMVERLAEEFKNHMLEALELDLEIDDPLDFLDQCMEVFIEMKKDSDEI